MKIIKYLLLFILINCKSQEKPNHISLNYNVITYAESSSYFLYSYESDKNSFYVNHKMDGVQKELKIILSQQELRQLYEKYSNVNFSGNVLCIYNDDHTLSNKIIIKFNEKKIDNLDKCIKKEKDKFLDLSTEVLKLIKSKKEYKDAFPWEFEKM